MVVAMGFSVLRIHELGSPDQVLPIFNPILKASSKFDAIFYLRIATDGYGSGASALPVFFPLFPMTVRVLTDVLPMSPLVAGYLLNTVASFFAMLSLYLLADDLFGDRRGAVRSLLLFAAFPFSYFLSAFYSEALFCALTFGAFLFARRRVWWASCVLLALATATRFAGVVAVIAVFVEYLSSRGFSLRRLDRRAWWFLLGPLGLVAYMWYLQRHFGDALYFKNAYRYGWGFELFQPNILSTFRNELSTLWNLLVHHRGDLTWKDAFVTESVFFGSWVLGAAAIGSAVRKIPVSYVVYGFASLLLFCLNSNFISVNRFLVPLFPLFLIGVAHTRRSETAYSLLLASSAVGLGVFLTMFSNGFWTG